MSERTRVIQQVMDRLTAPRPVTQEQADGTTEAFTYALAHEEPVLRSDTMRSRYPTTTHRDAYDEVYVRYWSVLEQRWRRIYHPTGCPDEDYAALPQTDREQIDQLPAPPY